MWSVAAVFLCCCVVLGQVQDSDAQVVDTKVSFGASLGSGCGPYNTWVTLAYRVVNTNIGGAYNPGTGIFIAPVKGAYFFSFSGHNHTSRPMGLSLMKNGVRIATVFNHRHGNHYETAANSMVLTLEKFDNVYIVLFPHTWVFENVNRHSTFSGFLLHPL